MELVKRKLERQLHELEEEMALQQRQLNTGCCGYEK